MLKTEKVLQIKTSVGRRLRVVREHYIREDVPCYSELCIDGCKNDLKGRIVNILPKDVTHYLVPDCTLARDYFELLELPDIQGVIFFQTVANSVQHEGSRRLYRRLTNLVHDPNKRSIVFSNEYQKYAYCVRNRNESLTQWQARSVYGAASWFYNHLAGQIPIIIITHDKYLIDTFGDKNPSVFTITMEQYLSSFWPNLDAAFTLYQSLHAALKEVKQKVSDVAGYLPTDVIEAGLKSGRFVQGRINVNKHNAQNEAFISPTGTKTKDSVFSSDILISGSAARNHTVHGDRVVVEILPKSQWISRTLSLSETTQDDQKEESREDSNIMPTGKVVGVLQRNWRDYVVSFSQDEETQRKAGKVLVIPWDRRIPKIRISTAQVDSLRDHRILVRIDSWEPDSQYPNGHFVRSLGKIGELETEVATILIEHSISNATPFSEAQLKELPVNSWDNQWKMEPDEIEKRRDLRDTHLIFSIDPKGCEDVDDALSVRKLENGNLELGVHIADVTYFVPYNSLSDLEAKSRSTTVYLADRRYDMLPEVLSADLCSLLGGVDRYAMSVIWELDKKYEVKNVWYGRSVIRSQYKLFYEIAQEMYDNAPNERLIANIPELQDVEKSSLDKKLSDLRWAVSTLIDIARGINARRTSGGALVLEGVEVQVQFSDKSRKTIEDLLPKQAMEIHETIAECMIFANHWVAKRICQAFPEQSLLRRHPMPRQNHFDALQTCAKAKGFSIDTTSNKSLADSLDKSVDPNDQFVNKLLRSMATQAMSNAEYFSTGSVAREQFYHYGLALDYYTHFTSPIRRYSDIVVHRLLLAAISQGGMAIEVLPGNKELNEIAEHMNSKHRAAQYAQKESLQLFQMMFFASQSEEARLADAIIFQIRANGFLVFLPRYGVKGAIYLRSKDGQVFYLTSEGLPEWTAGSLTTRGNTSITINSVLGTHSYKVFDHITVRINVLTNHAHTSSLQLRIVSNSPYQDDGSMSTKAEKDHMIKTVTAAVSDQRTLEEEDILALGEHFLQFKAEYGQTPDQESLYALFQRFSESALIDV